MRKYKLRLIIYNVNILFFILLFLIISQNYKAYLQYKNENIKEGIAKVYQIRANIDQQILTQVEGLTNRFLDDEVIQESINTWGYEFRYTDMYRMKERMQDLINSYEHIAGLDIYYTQQDIIFLSGNYKELSSHVGGITPYVDWIYDMENFQKAEYWIPTRYYEPLEQEVATYVATVPLIPSIKRGRIAIHLDAAYIAEYGNAAFLSEDSRLAIANREGISIKGQLSPIVTEAIVDDELTEDKYMIYEEVDISRIAFYDKSVINDWIYIYDMPLEQVYKTREFILKNLFIGLILITLSIGISVLINHLIFGPISQIFSIIKELPTGNEYESMKNEASFLKGKLSDTLDKFEIIQSELEQNKQIICNNHIRNLMLGHIGIEDIDSNLYDSMKMHFPNYFTMFIKLKMHYEGSIIEELEELRRQLCLQDADYQVYTLIENRVIKCLVNYNGSVSEKEKIINKITVGLKVDSFFSIGKSHDGDTGSMLQSTNQALAGLTYAYFRPNITLWDYEKEGVGDFKLTGSRGFIIGNIEKAILLKDSKAVDKELTHIIQALSYGKYHSDYCINTCSEVAATIRRAFELLGHPLDDDLGYDIRNTVSGCEHIYHLESTLKEIVSSGLESIGNREKSPDLQLKEDITTIISNNLCNDISLQMIADRLEIRYDTLSKNFKNVMGCSFSQYIREEKLNKAIELLQSSDYTIKEISKMLGYNSTQYFIQLFKEKYDMTPKRYQTLKLLPLENKE